MSKHSDNKPGNAAKSAEERRRLIGLGERSFHKSYYPELRKRLEELERFRTLLDQANDAILLVKLPEALIVDCNESAARSLRLSREEILGSHASELFDDENCRGVLRTLSNPEAANSGTHQVLCIHMPLQNAATENDAPEAMELTISMRGIGDERYAVIVARDVSKRMRTEQALREAEENYRSIFENALEGIYQATYEGRLLSLNPAFASIFGYDSAEHMLQDVNNVRHDIYHKQKDRDTFLKTLVENDVVRDYELRLRRKDGVRIWVAVNARLFRNEVGEPDKIEGFVADITARREFQEELARLNRRLESKVRDRTRDLELKARELEDANRKLRELDAMKNSLLSSVSHELRTPLTSVLGFTRLIEKDFSRAFSPLAKGKATLEQKANRIHENLEIIRHESERLTRMINDFLDLSKIESGRIEWNDCRVKLDDAVNGTIQAVRGTLDGKPFVTLDISLPDDMPPLFIDPDRLFQVLHNLLSNAVKFTNEGVIKLEATITEADELHLVVVDSGAGIPEEDLESIFTKFHQVRWDEAQGPKPYGTGLGLAICKQIIEHYGGRIWAESPAAGGAALHFILPLVDSRRLEVV